MFQFAPLTRIAVSTSEDDLHEADWNTFFVSFPTLIHLHLSGSGRLEVVWIALKAGLGDIPSPAETMRCPQLKSIESEGIVKRSERGSHFEKISLVTLSDDIDDPEDAAMKDVFVWQIAALAVDCEVYVGGPTEYSELKARW
ncbi:hypothetical protein BV20DRAFT_970920 [Pilatotrama ljubarskyi]|nr:hypothetical protein BV20DRAFT_970920 [Pilatotrama ljubarskyi]